MALKSGDGLFRSQLVYKISVINLKWAFNYIYNEKWIFFSIRGSYSGLVTETLLDCVA